MKKLVLSGFIIAKGIIRKAVSFSKRKLAGFSDNSRYETPAPASGILRTPSGTEACGGKTAMLAAGSCRSITVAESARLRDVESRPKQKICIVDGVMDSRFPGLVFPHNPEERSMLSRPGF
jgi:hypothetical protein